MVRKILCFYIILISIFYSFAENQSKIKLSFTEAVSSTDNYDGSYHTGIGEAEINFVSTNNSNIKGELNLKSIFSEESDFEINKAFIKARLPNFRITMGKTRLSWGEGFLFNAGDVIFNSASLLDNLNSEFLREETLWLNSFYIPLGRFSFIETITVPESLEISFENEGSEERPESDKTSGGLRIVSKLNNTKIESGYYFNAIEEFHKPYISLQGHLLYNWHLSASSSLNNETENYKENLKISVGIYNFEKTKNNSGLSFRIEGLISPDFYWDEKENIHDLEKSYGIFIYPEFIYTPNQKAAISLRSIISPIDESALWTTAFSWNIYQGFNIISFISVQSGEKSDIYSINNENALSLSIKFEFIF